jgi:hypothetical protein
MICIVPVISRGCNFLNAGEVHMPKENEEDISDNDSGGTFHIPERIKKSLPEEFDIGEIGAIDLREAEDIASEDIPLFSEDDLAGGLEDLDFLYPQEGAGNIEEAAEESTPDIDGKSMRPVKEKVNRPEDIEDHTLLTGVTGRADSGRKSVEMERIPVADKEDEGSTPGEHHTAKPGISGPTNRHTEDADMPERKAGRGAEPRSFPKEDDFEPLPDMVNREEVHKKPDAGDRPDYRQESRGATDETELDAIVGDIVQIEEGESYTMRVADVEEDQDQIAVLPDGMQPAYEELYIDTAHKYRDEEIDFIHAAVVEEDYRDYISEIDEFYGARGNKTVSNAVELLGLTADEYDSMEDALFEDEFKDAGIFDRHQLFEFGKPTGGISPAERIHCRYLLPRIDSLTDYERESIEGDVSSESALIFEEDVEEISSQFREVAGQEVSEPFEQVRVMDITDRVVILDDESDVGRFLMEFPEKKRADIKLLLKYLDGLFEKLPEEVIKKFTDSEYFDLYLKVLNELGV